MNIFGRAIRVVPRRGLPWVNVVKYINPERVA
jgi:hypothetical protein